jgi:hypothetical protein
VREVFASTIARHCSCFYRLQSLDFSWHNIDDLKVSTKAFMSGNEGSFYGTSAKEMF